jgi:hypothetical protein
VRLDDRLRGHHQGSEDRWEAMRDLSSRPFCSCDGRRVSLGDLSAAYRYTTQYLAHYHTERNHQGLGNQLITPEPDIGSQSGQVRRRKRLGGLLSYYYRDAA